MNFPFVLNLTSLMAHAAKEAREAVAEGKSGKINFLGATQYCRALRLVRGFTALHKLWIEIKCKSPLFFNRRNMTLSDDQVV